MKNEREEEQKDEMKNRISLALKDPILQQGFEIICKENAELKDKLEKETAHRIRNFNKAIEWKEKHRTLIKENAELTDKLETGIALKDEEISCILTDFNTFKSEAEEIIKELLSSCFGYSSKTVNYEVKAKAERFLKINA